MGTEIGEFIKVFEGSFDGIEPGSVSGDTRFRELKTWDSLAALMLADTLQQAYGVMLPKDVLAGCETVSDLAQAVDAARA